MQALAQILTQPILVSELYLDVATPTNYMSVAASALQGSAEL